MLIGVLIKLLLLPAGVIGFVGVTTIFWLFFNSAIYWFNVLLLLLFVFVNPCWELIITVNTADNIYNVYILTEIIFIKYESIDSDILPMIYFNTCSISVLLIVFTKFWLILFVLIYIITQILNYSKNIN